MKSEEFIMQELEKDRVQEEGQGSSERKNIKFMISAEAPLLMSKACELLIKEISSRAWQHTERNRRRTLQRQDVHAAVGECDVYDFLIDIVPRVSTTGATGRSSSSAQAVAAGVIPQAIHDPSAMPNLSMPQLANMYNPAASLTTQGGGTDLGIHDPIQGGQFNSSLFFQQMTVPNMMDGQDNGTGAMPPMNFGVMPQPGQPDQHDPQQQQDQHSHWNDTSV